MPPLPRRVVLLAALTLLSCSRLQRLTRPDRAVKPRVVGAVLPLSGDYELVGKSLLAGAKLALQGTNVTLVVRDSQGDPAIAEQMLEELATGEGVIAVLGGVADEAERLARRADSLGVPLITFAKAENITDAGRYVFRDGPSVRAQGKAIAEYGTCHLGLRQFAILAPATEYGTTLTEAFTQAATAQGGEVKHVARYPAEQTTFTQEIQQLAGRSAPEERADYQAAAQRIRAEEPDAFRQRKALEKLKQTLPPEIDFQGLFLPDGWKTVTLIAPALAVENLVTTACNAASVERIQKTTGAASVASVRLLGAGGWSAPISSEGTSELIRRGGRHMQCGVYVDSFFPASSRPATRAFVQRFRQKHGEEAPTQLHALGHDAGAMFRHVIARAAPQDSHLFRDALEKLSGFSGATGDTTFDGDRNAVKPLFVVEVQAGSIKEVPIVDGCRAPLARASAGEAHHGL